MTEPTSFRHCSTCKRQIAFESKYYRCSVSTCNRKPLEMYFCSVPCWDAHVPEARHRDAWAEPAHAPSRAAWDAERAVEVAAADKKRVVTPVARDDAAPVEPRRKIVGASEDDSLPQEVLVVVSKLKAYVKARSGMNTSDGVAEALSEHLRKLCNAAILKANEAGRKTVMDRDFEALPELLSSRRRN